jgi:hypothetical protein
MKKYLVIIPLLFVALGAPKASRVDQSYDVNITVGSDTLTGTIDTDGLMGTLSTKDLNWFSLESAGPYRRRREVPEVRARERSRVLS